jgi:hypothetical protein
LQHSSTEVLQSSNQRKVQINSTISVIEYFISTSFQATFESSHLQIEENVHLNTKNDQHMKHDANQISFADVESSNDVQQNDVFSINNTILTNSSIHFNDLQDSDLENNDFAESFEKYASSFSHHFNNNQLLDRSVKVDISNFALDLDL